MAITGHSKSFYDMKMLHTSKSFYLVIFCLHGLQLGSSSLNGLTRATRQLVRLLAVVMCLSVRLSQVGVLLKRLNVGSRKQRHMIAQGL